jgi:hypothetical protein
MKNQAPFLDVKSFISEEIAQETPETSGPPSSPFLSVYESDDNGALIDPVTEEYVVFLNEIYDEEFDDALSELVNEAVTISETRFSHELNDPRTIGYEAERLLDQHFSPLNKEVETMFGALAAEFSRRNADTLTDNEIDLIIDQYSPSIELNPNFDEFLGKIKKGIKKVAKKAVGLAKKGIGAAAKMGLGPILNKLKTIIKPLLKRVIQTAIGKLPPQLQPIAKKLAERLPFLKEVEEMNGYARETLETCEVAHIQYEFNQHLANVLFASTEVELELEIAQAHNELKGPDVYPIIELDRARDNFVENLLQLKEGQDPTPHIENFIPAILPALRVGIRIVGRKRVVDFLANLLGKLIQKFVGPQHTPALSRAIVDAGLRLLQLEASAEDETRAAASAVAATVEDTVRRVADAPDYILDDQELLEGFVLEAFEHAAAANLPPILPEEIYKKRPELGDARKLQGVWTMMPRGRRKRYKKYSRIIPTRISPHKVASLETYEGIPLEEFLEEELDIDPGEEVEALVHLYEAIPGTKLSDIARLEENSAGLDPSTYQQQLHPLTREAAELLLGEPDLAPDNETEHQWDPHTPKVGERFYYLEIPGRRPLTSIEPSGRTKARRPTQLRLILDFPKNEIRVYLFLSEIRAQEIAVKLRQHAHIGNVAARLRHFIERGLRSALRGSFGRLKIIHEAITPDQLLGAVRRLPSLVPQVLQSRLQEWILKGITDQLKQRAEEFTKAAEDTTDGVTMVITVGNPPGFTQLRQVLKGKLLSLASLKMSGGTPTVRIKIVAGYIHE